jgi:hypothetical protein
VSSVTALLDAAERLTEDLLAACDGGTATIEEIVSALDHRERLLRQLEPGSSPTARDRATAERLRALDDRLSTALRGRKRAIGAQLARVRRRPAPSFNPPGRLLVESA